MTEAKKMQWAVYAEHVEKLPSVALQSIIVEATKAIAASPTGINAGYYTDEISICAQELRSRSKRTIQRHETIYHKTLTQMFLILREAGYDSDDMVDDLRDLVNDSQRPATEEDEGKMKFGDAGPYQN